MTDTNINTNINTTLFKTKPFEHQIKTLQESWYKHNWALFMEMGTGKSKVTIDTAVQLYSAGLIDAVLIFAPKSVDRVLLEEQLPSHFPDQVPLIASHWSSTANKELKNQWKKFNGFNGLKIMIVNIEAISYDNGHK